MESQRVHARQPMSRLHLSKHIARLRLQAVFLESSAAGDQQLDEMRIHFLFRTGVVDGRRDAVCISGVFFQAPAINIEQLLVLFGHVGPQVVLWSDIVGKMMA